MIMKCVAKNDHCSSCLIVSIKLSSIQLKTSNPKKDDNVIFTDQEPSNADIVRRQRDYVCFPGIEEFLRRWFEILNLKFVKLLLSYLVVQQHHCQMKEFLIVLLMSLVMGTVYYMPFQF
uniref:Uncharacterized protein n=1 Tax=Amphimedon queenslandica TaxID=400682 RepID=A0A1X7TK61_AMPQE